MSLVKNNEYIGINKAFGVQEFGELLESVMGRESKHTKKVSFAPSGLGYSGSCARYWYYALNGAMFNYDTAALAVANMDAGSDSGRRLAALLDKAGILVVAEKEAKYDDPPIRGYIDAIINWKGEEVVVEIKTTKLATFNYRFTKNVVPGYQLIQLLIYMYIEQKDKGFFLTECKDSNEIYIHPVKMTAENKQLVENVLAWMRKVKDNAENGELPVRPFTKSSMQCKGCAVRDTCWEGWTRGKVNGTDPNPGAIEIPALVLPK